MAQEDERASINERKDVLPPAVAERTTVERNLSLLKSEEGEAPLFVMVNPGLSIPEIFDKDAKKAALVRLIRSWAPESTQSEEACRGSPFAITDEKPAIYKSLQDVAEMFFKKFLVEILSLSRKISKSVSGEIIISFVRNIYFRLLRYQMLDSSTIQ